MFTLHYTGTFTKDIRRIKKRAYNTQLLYEALFSLESDGIVPPEFKPHKLSGNYSDCWDCHLKPDWLLIWRKDEIQKEIQLVRTGTHSDLFK
jgi:mRNA interferase YafQ